MLNLLGVTILLAGLGSATFIWLDQDRIDRQKSGAELASPEDSRRYTHDVELYYGETGMLMEKWKRWVGEMTRGKPLADIIAIVSLVSAGGLFYLASRHNRPPGPQEPP